MSRTFSPVAVLCASIILSLTGCTDDSSSSDAPGATPPTPDSTTKRILVCDTSDFTVVQVPLDLVTTREEGYERNLQECNPKFSEAARRYFQQQHQQDGYGLAAAYRKKLVSKLATLEDNDAKLVVLAQLGCEYRDESPDESFGAFTIIGELYEQLYEPSDDLPDGYERSLTGSRTTGRMGTLNNICPDRSPG